MKETGFQVLWAQILKRDIKLLSIPCTHLNCLRSSNKGQRNSVSHKHQRNLHPHKFTLHMFNNCSNTWLKNLPTDASFIQFHRCDESHVLRLFRSHLYRAVLREHYLTLASKTSNTSFLSGLSGLSDIEYIFGGDCLKTHSNNSWMLIKSYEFTRSWLEAAAGFGIS